MRLRLTIAAVCALALLGPASARANDGDTVVDATVAQYMQIAAAYWGATPHCTGPNGELIEPYAIWGYNANPFEGGWAEMPGCRMWLNSRQWPAPPNESQCNLIAHEWGHLLGHDHSPDPGDLMYGGEVPLVVPGCSVFVDAPIDDGEPAAAPAHKLIRHAKAHKKAKRRKRCAPRTRKRALRRAARRSQKRCVRKPRHVRHRARRRRRA
jgi:hypothetical protein